MLLRHIAKGKEQSIKDYLLSVWYLAFKMANNDHLYLLIFTSL